MRPLRLCMTGFGPYKEKTVIDMSSLGRGGIYLITGDTGSGKTYIFDAITYALYGDMSGSGRDVKTVRSQYSDPGDITEVELDFEYRGKVYKVVRNPEYVRAKKRGEGTAKESANAALILPGGNVIDGSLKVTEEIKRILGIDRNQFRSIAMIAQGEFRDVLNSSTDERIKLFRRLFNTEPYDRLAGELGRLGKEVREKFDRRQADLKTALETISCSFDEELENKLVDLKENELPQIEDICELLELAISRGKAISVERSHELEIAEDELKAASNRLALIDQYKENVESLEKARDKVSLLTEDVERAEKALEKTDSIKEESDKLKSEASIIDGSMESYDKLDQIKKELDDIEKALDEKTCRLEQAGHEQEKADSSYKDLLNEKEALRYTGEQLIRVRNDIERTTNRISILNGLISDISKVKELQEQLAKEQIELDPIIEEAKEVDIDLAKMRAAFLREQAGIIAADLKDGKPCPVCGSIHHPDPAVLSENAPSAAEIEEKEEESQNAHETVNEKSKSVNKIKGNLNATILGVRETASRETGTDDIDAANKAASEDKDKLEDDLKALRSTEVDLDTKSRRLNEIDNELKKSKDELDGLTKDIEGLKIEISSLNASAEGAKHRKEDIKKLLLFDSKKEAENRVNDIAVEVENNEQTVKALEEAYTEAVSEKTSNDARIEELKKIVEGFSPDDEEAAREAGYNAEHKKKDLSDEILSLRSDVNSCESALKCVKDIEGDLKDIRKEHMIIDSLSRTASGSLTGKDRLSLETYVQTYYFDRVIKRANRRLLMISGGQYEFARGGQARDKRSHYGLDLEVVDHYSGSRRPAGTLSGGESFYASLSLALGLSDEVQASAGGIKLDTMFVDEGFGSLDSETLEQAIRTLTELSGDDLLVGIISHVEALKTRIDKQIVVSKDRVSGSKVKLITM